MNDENRLTDRQLERIESLLEKFNDDQICRILCISEKLTPDRLKELEKILDAGKAVKIIWIAIAALLGPLMIGKISTLLVSFVEFLGKK